jgi:hypothetical protein
LCSLRGGGAEAPLSPSGSETVVDTGIPLGAPP